MNRERIQNIAIFLSAARLLPLLAAMLVSRRRDVIEADLLRWHAVLRGDHVAFNPWRAALRFLTLNQEFRNLFYHRLGWPGSLLSPLCRPMPSLFIATRDIGPGLFIQHGFATIIAAERLGRNCWVNQQVTIGYTNEYDCPVLEDNVTVSAGAKVIGKVLVGRDSVIGANAVVIRDVPAGATAVGVPAKVVKVYGRRSCPE